MKKSILTLIFLLIATAAHAKTLYVGPGGNSACNGSKDVPWSQGQVDCRLDHPFRALPPNGNNKVLLQGGDTLFIDGSYNMGFGVVSGLDTATCYPNWAYDCFSRAVPSGTPQQLTKIIGRNNAVLKGVERARLVLNLNGSSNVEIRDIEITDNSSCMMQGPDAATRCQRDTPPFGPWAETGLGASDSQNVLLYNVNIHGLWRGVYAGRLSNWKIEKSKIVANSFVGWDGDITAFKSSNSGTMEFIDTEINYNGCGEKIDGTPYNCYSQDQSGYGDGLGTHQTGAKWIFKNCTVKRNTSDGIDLLYHDGSNDISFDGGYYGENAGNQIKTNGKITSLSNLTNGGHCSFFKTNPQFLWNTSTFNYCRAGGDSLAAGLQAGSQILISNVKFEKVQNFGILTVGSNCNGSEKVIADDKTTFELLDKFWSPGNKSQKYYADGSQGAGPCKNIQLVGGVIGGGGGIPPVCVPTQCPAPCGQSGVNNCGQACQGIPCLPDDVMAPVITEVKALEITETTAVISWKLDEFATGQVEFGLTADYGSSPEIETSFGYKDHLQDLANLTKATTYHFRVKSKDRSGNLATSPDFTFTTLGGCVPIPCVPACGQSCTDNCGNVTQGEVCPVVDECSVEVIRAKCADVKVSPIL